MSTRDKFVLLSEGVFIGDPEDFLERSVITAQDRLMVVLCNKERRLEKEKNMSWRSGDLQLF